MWKQFQKLKGDLEHLKEPDRSCNHLSEKKCSLIQDFDYFHQDTLNLINLMRLTTKLSKSYKLRMAFFTTRIFKGQRYSSSNGIISLNDLLINKVSVIPVPIQ
jgi:hypothetical protein